jgi:hypothetical protein
MWGSENIIVGRKPLHTLPRVSLLNEGLTDLVWLLLGEALKFSQLKENLKF